VNNDDQIELKGSIPFMDEDHRRFIMSQFRDVDFASISIDSEKTVCESIACVKDEYDFLCHKDKPTYLFFNSGDRSETNSENKEVQLCKELGIEYVTLPLPKIYSSSELIKKAAMEI
jgi:glycerol-3-phosphate cytidylyltransferase-like family protein